MERYSRHIRLSEIGTEGQQKITQAKVLVIGAGGLGCPALQYLTAAGVGTLGIMDFDTVEESNLQRQVLFGSSSLGMNKAIAAKKRLEDLNPMIHIKAYPTALTRENAVCLFQDYDMVIDGTDRIETRYLINDASLITDTPVIYGAIYKFEGQVGVFNYRKGPTYRCLFPNPPKEGSVASCSDIGVLGVLPGIIGCMQANEALKLIIGLPGILTGKLLCYHAHSGQSTSIAIPNKSKDRREKLKQAEKLTEDYARLCTHPVKEISISDALQRSELYFLDVREPGELPLVDLPNSIQIPLAEIDQKMESLRFDGPVVVFCASGIRSRIAIEKLEQQFSNTFYNLSAGAETLLQHIKSNP